MTSNKLLEETVKDDERVYIEDSVCAFFISFVRDAAMRSEDESKLEKRMGRK